MPVAVENLRRACPSKLCPGRHLSPASVEKEVDNWRPLPATSRNRVHELEC